MYDACGNALSAKSKRGSAERIEPSPAMLAGEQKLRPILKKRDASLAARQGMIKSHSLDINDSTAAASCGGGGAPHHTSRKSESMLRFNQSREMAARSLSSLSTRPASPEERPSSPQPPPPPTSEPLVSLVRKGSVRRSRQEAQTIQEPPKKVTKAKKKRSDREVVMTNESIHEQEDTVENLSKPKSFMKKMFFM